MLARLEAIEGVADAQVDHSGELLRLRLTTDQALPDAVATLRELGYGADELDQVPVIERWYGRETVRELSREESAVIARRVIPPFARSHGIAPSTSGQLEELVARTLYACFAARTLEAGTVPGALLRECVDAVEAAVRDLLDAEGARELAALLLADLDRVASTERQAG